MICLVTGANGFVGSHLVEALAARGHAVRCLVRPTSDLTALEGVAVEIVYGDVRRPEGLDDAVRGAAWVFHAAGVTKALRPADYMAANRDGVRNLLAACGRAAPRPRRVVLVSSLAAVGPARGGAPVDERTPPAPVSLYGRSKLAGERAARRGGGVPLSVIRPCAVYGPRDRDMLLLFRQARAGWLPLLAGGTRALSLIHAADLADLALRAAAAPTPAVYMAADPTPYPLRRILRALAAATGRRPRVPRIPRGLAEAAVGLADLWNRARGRAALLNRDKLREACCPRWTCSAARAVRELGFRPGRTLEEGFAATAAWYRENGWL
jgi:nucleoside-diphosphate-sugar epimerase